MSSRPTISMSRISRMDLLDHFDYRLPGEIAHGRFTFVPFIIAGAAHTHHGADIRYRKVS